MLRKSKRSSIALTVLIIFVLSIACCLPVSMAEDPPLDPPPAGPPVLTYDLAASPVSLSADYTEQSITLTASEKDTFSGHNHVDLWVVDNNGMVVGANPLWGTDVIPDGTNTIITFTLPVIIPRPATGLYALVVAPAQPGGINHSAHFELTPAASNLIIDVSSPEQGAQIIGPMLDVAGTVAGQPAWFRAEVWNYDANERPVQVPDIDITDINQGSFAFTINLAELMSGFTAPGDYELSLLAGFEGDSEGIRAPVAYSIVGSQPPPDGPVQINLTPDQIPAGGEVAFTFDLTGVTLQNSPYAGVAKPPTEPGGQPTRVLLAVPVNQSEAGCQVSFTETITEPGDYRLIVFDGQPTDPNNLPPVVAVGGFTVSQYPWLRVNPQGVPAYFRQSQVIELWNNNPPIWDVNDILEVRLVNYKGTNPEHAERVVEATIQNNDLKKTNAVIKFYLPAAVDCGYHEVELVRANNVIGKGGFNIGAPCCYETDPHPLFTDAQDKTVSLHEGDPETWHANEAGKLRVLIAKKKYFGHDLWEYDLEHQQTIEPANLMVNENTISFTFSPDMPKGGYELMLQRQINNEFWRTVGWGAFHYTDPLIYLQFGSEQFSGEPPAVKEGYELPINFTLTDNGGTAWSVGEQLTLNLYSYNRSNNRWDIMPPHLQPYEVVVNEDSISAKLPDGIGASDYTITVSPANAFPDEEFALSEFRVLPFIELQLVNLPPAQVNQEYRGTIKVKGGKAPYSWSINTVPPENRWPGGLAYDPDENDSSQLIITGTFTEPGVYPLEIQVEDNEGRLSYHGIRLVVREGMPRVIACNAIGLPGREVMAPIMGENLMGTGVSGIQFTLDYDPAVATIAPNGVLPGMIPDANIQSNIDNVNGHAYITIAWTQPLPEQVNFAEFCRIKYQINSNPANKIGPVCLNGMNGTLLTHGQYDIPAEVINGTIRATSYGDVNGNGKVEVGDAVLILRYSAGIINLHEPLIELADVDGDFDGVGPDDAILILQRVVHLIDKFPIEP